MCIYHQSPPICFGVPYTILRETIALRAQLYALCSVGTYAVLTKIVEGHKTRFIFHYRTGFSQDLYIIMDPSTAGYTEHMYCQRT